MNVMAAGIALLLSLAFTLVAVWWPDAATIAAVPFVIAAVLLMIIQARQGRRRV